MDQSQNQLSAFCQQSKYELQHSLITVINIIGAEHAMSWEYQIQTR